LSNKLTFTINIEDEDGNKQVTPISIEVDVPDHTEFPTFREGFAKLEKASLKA
jgi:hypothetical protein